MSVSTAADRLPLSNNVALGDRVEFTAHLERAVNSLVRNGREWRRWITPGPARSGIIIGKRTLANGVVEWEENYSYFVPGEHLRVYLVTFDLHRKPVHVLPEDVTFL